MKYVPRHPDESVNVSRDHPLVDFGFLLLAVGLAGAALYALLGALASWWGGRISMEQELAMAEWATGRSRQERAAGPREPAYLYLRRRVDALAALSPGLSGPLPLTITAGPANAFMFPGGTLGVTSGLLAQAKTENELDFVLAHELGHFFHRHAVRGLGRGLVLLGAGMALGLGGGQGEEGVLSFIFRVSALTHSRLQENQADLFALELVRRRWGHVGHATDFFERLDEGGAGPSNPALPAYFSTHPHPGDRIRQLRELALREGWHLEGPAPPPPSFLAVEGAP